MNARDACSRHGIDVPGMWVSFRCRVILAALMTVAAVCAAGPQNALDPPGCRPMALKFSGILSTDGQSRGRARLLPSHRTLVRVVSDCQRFFEAAGIDETPAAGIRLSRSFALPALRLARKSTDRQRLGRARLLPSRRTLVRVVSDCQRFCEAARIDETLAAGMRLSRSFALPALRLARKSTDRQRLGRARLLPSRRTLVRVVSDCQRFFEAVGIDETPAAGMRLSRSFALPALHLARKSTDGQRRGRARLLPSRRTLVRVVSDCQRFSKLQGSMKHPRQGYGSAGASPSRHCALPESQRTGKDSGGRGSCRAAERWSAL
jgi:hypothetical protein